MSRTLRKYLLYNSIPLFLSSPVFAASPSVPVAECGVDLARFCQEATPGVAQLTCLSEHNDELSDACKASVDQLNTNRTWQDVSRTIPDGQGGQQRRYLVHLPRGYVAKQTYPVVLLFHGIASSPEKARKQTRMNEVADQNKFIVVYPEAIHESWNAGRCCGDAVKYKVDDVGFVSAVLDDLEKNYPVDKARVYAAGVDNGGMLAYRLGCELTRRLAGIASVGGTMAVDGPRPARIIPVLEMHSIYDKEVPFRGGRGKGGALADSAHRSIPATMSWWAKNNYCRKKAVQSGQDLHGHFEIEIYEPVEDEPGKPVILYKLLEEGPVWPDGFDVAHGWASGSLVQSVNASQIIWKFFYTHSNPLPEN